MGGTEKVLGVTPCCGEVALYEEWVPRGDGGYYSPDPREEEKFRLLGEGICPLCGESFVPWLRRHGRFDPVVGGWVWDDEEAWQAFRQGEAARRLRRRVEDALRKKVKALLREGQPKEALTLLGRVWEVLK